jgi:hypothetical protein
VRWDNGWRGLGYEVRERGTGKVCVFGDGNEGQKFSMLAVWTMREYLRPTFFCGMEVENL